MKLLEEKIRSEGKALSETVLKVDGFINHQVDPVLMSEIGKTLASYYKDKGVTKVFTIESSGIAPAVYTAMELGVPMVILKKQTSKILTGDVFQTNITSFTKGTSYELTLSQNYIQPDDVVLVIDDFLANGEAATGATRLVEMVVPASQELPSSLRRLSSAVVSVLKTRATKCAPSPEYPNSDADSLNSLKPIYNIL